MLMELLKHIGYEYVGNKIPQIKKKKKQALSSNVLQHFCPSQVHLQFMVTIINIRLSTIYHVLFAV